MNEPLITLRETHDGHAVRRFADADAPHGGAVLEQPGLQRDLFFKDLVEHVRAPVTQLGHAAATLARVGLKLVARR